jgi:hypothetical protein
MTFALVRNLAFWIGCFLRHMKYNSTAVRGSRSWMVARWLWRSHTGLRFTKRTPLLANTLYRRTFAQATSASDQHMSSGEAPNSLLMPHSHLGVCEEHSIDRNADVYQISSSRSYISPNSGVREINIVFDKAWWIKNMNIYKHKYIYSENANFLAIERMHFVGCTFLRNKTK